MTITNNYFLKFTPKELRFLIKHFDTLDEDVNSVKSDIADKLREFSMSQLPEILWAPMYELSFMECMGTLAYTFGISDRLKEFGQIESTQEKMNEIASSVIHNLDSELDSSKEDSREFTLGILSITYVLIASVKALSVYGCYLNDLIRVARESDNRAKADSALIKAVKIDPAVIACSTAAKRVSYAVLTNDTTFLEKLKKAMSGKLGVRESKNYRQMRYILQVLHEEDGLNRSDEELTDLFVNELKVYSDSQNSAQKNISEFKRKFKAQKSTI